MSIAALIEKRNRILAEATALVDARTKEEREKYAALLKQSDEIQEDIDILKRLDVHFAQHPEARQTPVAAPAIITTPNEKEERQATNAAWRSFFKFGHRPNATEQRALLTISDAAGSAIVAQAFDTTFTEAAKFYGPVWNLVNRKDADNSEPTKFAVTDDTARTFSLVTEGTTSAISVAQTPSVFSDITNTDTLISSVIYSVQELDDAFNLESFLKRNAGVAVSRAWEWAISRGHTNDTANSALPNSPTGGLLGSVTAAITQTAGQLAAGPTYAQLSSLASSVDRAYYQDGGFMASPSVEAQLRAQVDSTGRPLYQIDEATGFLRIAGKLLYPNAAMSAAGTPSVPLVLFGDYSRFYNVLNAGGVQIRVLSESPAANIFTKEMLIYTRIGASTGLSTSVKSLVSAAS